MHTIDCRVKTDEFNDVAKSDVTPAEVLVLRKLHTQAAGGDPIKDPVKKGIAMRNRDVRTDGEEHQRLRLKYPAKNPKTGIAIVEEVLGNSFQRLPQTFSELDTPNLKLVIGEAKRVSAEQQQEAQVVWDSAPAEPGKPEGDIKNPESGQPGAPQEPPLDEKRAALMKLTKDKLIEMATKTGATVTDEDTKATLVEKILTETGQVQE